MAEKINRTRGLVQLYAALLYNANAKGFLSGKLFTGGSKAVCVPGLNCYSCPGAIGACPLGSLQNALAASGHTAPYYVLGILLLFGVILGRTVCGWLCPMGLLQELLHKIPTPKIRKNRITRALSYLKYGILGVFVIALPLFYGLGRQTPLPAFCKYICPAGTLEGAVALLCSPANEGLFAQLGPLFTNKFLILLLIGLACVFCWRAFCRFLCPLGAIYGLFNRFALIGVKVDESRCTQCGACVARCQMDVRAVGDRECISCGKCLAHCGQGAISLRCGKIVLQGPEAAPQKSRKTGRVIWAVLLALLLGVGVYAYTSGTTEADAPEGFEVGQRMADFACTLLDGSEFRLSEHRGQIIFINQWATYCNPCVGELPYFEQLKEENPQIVVLAFHHHLEVNPDARTFITQKGWQDWGVLFAVDDDDETLRRAIGGDNTMPRTAVINGKGEVVYNETRSVTYETLNALLRLAQ